MFFAVKNPLNMLSQIYLITLNVTLDNQQKRMPVPDHNSFLLFLLGQAAS